MLRCQEKAGVLRNTTGLDQHRQVSLLTHTKLVRPAVTKKINRKKPISEVMAQLISANTQRSFSLT